MSYFEDKDKLDLVGFAKTAKMRVDPGPKDTVVVEQSGLFVTGPNRYDKKSVDRYVIVPKGKIPELIKRLREAAKA